MAATPPQTHHRPFVGSALFYVLWVNLIIFALQAVGQLREDRLYEGHLERMQFGSLAREDLFMRHEWWRLFTYMFVHDVPEPLHVGLNMLMVLFCGLIVQRALGGSKVIQIYVFGGLLGGIAHMCLFPEPVIGASASAFALLVAVGMLSPDRKVFVLLAMLLPVRMRLKYLVIGMMSVTVVFFFIDILVSPTMNIPMITNVGHLAHLGGGLAGYLYCKAIGVNRLVSLSDLKSQRVFNDARSPIRRSAITKTEAIANGDPEGFDMTAVDPVLNKIAREGFLALTADERALLQRGLSRMSRT